MFSVENHGCTDSENTSTTESNSNISNYLTDDGLEDYLDYYKRRGDYREDVYLDKVLKAIKLECELNEKEFPYKNIYDKINALRVACRENRTDVIKELLKFDEVLEAIRTDIENIPESAKKLERFNRAQETLSDAAFYSEKTLDLLLENGINIKTYGGNALRFATGNGKIEMMQKLLDHGVPIDSNIRPGVTALTVACINDHKNIVESLLKNGADIHVNNDYPMRMACFHGRFEVVKLLLKNGAKINNNESLYWACFHGRENVVKLLLENGADVNTEPAPLTATLNPKIVLILLEGEKEGEKVNVNVKNKVLRSACIKGVLETVKILLKAGATVDDDDKIIESAKPEIKELVMLH